VDRARLGPRRRRGRARRANHAGRHRDRPARPLRAELHDRGAGRAVCGDMRRAGQPAQGRQGHGRREVRQPGLRDVPRHVRALGSPGHRRGAHRHRRPLARAGLDPGGQGGQGRLQREALRHHDPRLPGPGRHDEPLPARVPGRDPAPQHRQLPVRRRACPQRQAGKDPHAARLDLRPAVPARLPAPRARTRPRRGRLGPLAGAFVLAPVQRAVRAGRVARSASGPTTRTGPCRSPTSPTAARSTPSTPTG